MHQIIEIAPGLVFVVSYFFFVGQNIYWATALFMVALVVQFIVCWLFKLKISKLMWVVFLVGMTTGTIAIAFQMPIIIKWRPTAISWAISIAFLFTHFFGRRNILKWLLEEYVQLPDRLWNFQTLVLGIVFFLSGTTNIVVAYTFTEKVWVLYKGIAWIVWPVLSAILMGIIFWLEHRRTGGSILELDSADAKSQDSESSKQDPTK